MYVCIKILHRLYIGYGLRNVRNLRVSSLAKDENDLDWIALSRSCLKSGGPSAIHGSGIPRTVRIGLINERRDRLKASVLVNGIDILSTERYAIPATLT